MTKEREIIDTEGEVKVNGITFIFTQGNDLSRTDNLDDESLILFMFMSKAEENKIKELLKQALEVLE